MKLTFEQRDQVYEAECAEGERILYAALRSGAPLPYECATGTCGTCRARAKPGSVSSLWPQAPGAERLSEEKGEFLMCQCIAAADCKVLVPGRPRAAAKYVPDYVGAALGNINRLNADVMSFDLALDSAVSYQAGQFFVARTADMTGSRAYSMTHYAQSTDVLSFVIKRLDGGVFSDWLFGEASAGDRLELFGPLGDAVFEPDMDKDLLCIAGGSGIAGIMAILDRCIQSSYLHERKAHVFFGVRTQADLFFADELKAFKAKAPEGLKITVALSDEESSENAHDEFSYATGFVHEVAMSQMAGQYANVMAYLAGPPVMVTAALKQLIIKAKLSPRDIRYDKFG